MSIQTWLIILFLTSISLSTNTSSMEISYKQHCNSIVPESIPTTQESNPETPLWFRNGYYKLHHHSHGRKQVSFFTKTLYRTKQTGLLKVEGALRFRGRSFNYSLIPSRIQLHGFWSESSGKLCMVGSGSGYSEQGKLVNLSSVLNLNYPKVSQIGTSLVTGSLKTLEIEDNENHVDPISILSFFPGTYQYSMLSKAKTMCSVFNTSPDDGFLKIDNTICHKINSYHQKFQLEYGGNCNIKNCNPFESLGFLPKSMFVYEIQCSDEGKLHVTLGFSSESSYRYYQELVPEATLVGEGVLDEEKNEICIVACHLLRLGDSLENTTVGDCSIGLRLRFPGFLSLRNRNSAVGQIWSNKNMNDSGYFERFMFRSPVNQALLDTPGLKYNYSFGNRSCGSGFLGWKKVIEKKLSTGRRRYPDGFSSMDMNVYLSVENSQGEKTWGSLTPLTISEHFYERTWYLSSEINLSKPLIHEQESNQNLFNVSYIIAIDPFFNSPLEISAEGIYDADNGILCMVGCRYVSLNDTSSNETLQESMDCEILINIQFPPQDLRWYESGGVSGIMKSMRGKSDPFYFEPLKFSSHENTGSIWGIGVDINMLMIFLAFASVVIGLQLYYIKNHPDGFPSVSLPMVVLLIVGHLVPLVFYFEAFFLDRFWTDYAVVLRAFSILTFLLQFCVLQSIWPARSIEARKRKILWALNVCLPLYLVGALIVFYVNWQVPALEGRGLLNSYGSYLIEY